MTTLRERLGALFGTTRPVIALLGGPERFMELAVRSLVRRRILVLADGELGERFAAIAETCGRDVARAGVAPGQAMRPEWLIRFLQGPEFDAVGLIHREAGTADPLPLAELSAAARTRNVLVIADLSRTIGRLPIAADQWGLDLAFAGGSGPSGWLSFGAASARAVDLARRMPARGQALDLAAHHDAAAQGTTLDVLPEPLEVSGERWISSLRS